jgi:16S rRNA (guanine527-N7)-methyltransferase
MEAGLAELSRHWGVPCGDGEIESLARYADLLLAWSQKINLTGATSVRALVGEHLPDSFALASVLGNVGQVVDVGSGGGLPALPLAVLRAGLEITLVEPIAKKVAFLRTAVRELELGGRVRVDARRAEVLADAGVRFDVATARAVLAPEAWTKLGASLVRARGRVVVLSAADPSIGGSGLAVTSQRVYLDGRRWLTVLERQA